VTILHPTPETATDLRVFLHSVREEITHHIQDAAVSHGGAKWYISVSVNMTRTSVDGLVEVCAPWFRSACATTLTGEEPNVQEAIEKVSKTFLHSVSSV